MTEKEAIKILDNIFTDMLIKKQCGEKYNIAIKTILVYYKHYRNGFERELESNKENALELIEKSKELEKKDKIIETMAEQLVGLMMYDNEKDDFVNYNTEEKVKEYFKNKVEDNK